MLDLYVREEAHKIDQSQLLKATGHRRNAGVCLTMSCCFIHLRRNGVNASDAIMLMNSNKAIFKEIVEIHAEYSIGNFSDGSMREFQESSTFIEIFERTRVILKRGGYIKDDRCLIVQAGHYPSGHRPSIKSNLLSVIHKTKPILFLITFNCKAGAHAIVLDAAFESDRRGTRQVYGILDPNYGWMRLENGLNGIDVSVILNAFVSDYEIRDAAAYQDITLMR